MDEISNIGKVFDIDFEDFLKKESPYLTSAQIMEMKNSGFTFGAHSMDHPDYRKLLLQEQLDQTIKSIQYVCENYRSEIKSFAFPFTSRLRCSAPRGCRART